MQEEEKFVETGGFIGVIVAAAVLLLCFMMCCACTIQNKKYIDAKRAELESKAEVAMTS